MLQRQVRTLRLSSADRAVLAALARLPPGGHRWNLRLIVSPWTLLRWDAHLVRWHRTPVALRSRAAQDASAVRALVLEMTRENPAGDTGASTAS